MTEIRHHHLVFMPGLDGTGFSVEPLLPYLAPDIALSIVRYPTKQIMSFAEMAECAARQFPAAAKPLVIAESFSGPVALQLIGSGRVQAMCLVLCATFAKSPRPVLMRIFQLLPLASLLRRRLPRGFLQFLMNDTELTDSLSDLWHKSHSQVSARVLQERFKILSDIDVTEWLAKISIPCLYIQASDDKLIPASALASLLKGIPHLQVKRIKGPHFILQTQPQACIEAIDNFLGAIESS